MKKNEMRITDLFDLNHTMAKELLEKYEYPWEALEELGSFVRKLGASLPKSEYDNPVEGIWISKAAKMARTVGLMAPVIIGPAADLRQCAFVRGNVIIGANAVVGNSTELKNTILFDFVQVPHYNYVGDSILGFRAHMGAGSITSNVKADKKLVRIHAEDGDIDTGRKKVGAMIGDGADIGCNAVLNPGTVIGRNSNVYPLCSVRGCVDADSIYKGEGAIVKKEQRE